MKKYNFDAEPFARAYVENMDKSVGERIGYAMLENAKFQPIEFMENCMLPEIKVFRDCDSAGYRYSNAILTGRSEDFDAHAAAYPGIRDELAEIRDKFIPATPCYMTDRGLSQTYRRLAETKACWGGTWGGHGNPDYGKFLHLGTNGIRAQIEEFRTKNPGKDAFYNSCTLAMDTLDVIGDRIAGIAEKKAAAEENPGKKAEWLKISETYKVVPREPAWDMFSATQMFWMLYSYEQPDSPGRYDQFMIDYYRKSSPEESEKCVLMFLEAMHNVRGWNVCLSGSDAAFNDESNELTYLVLRKVKELGYQTPNLTLRVHRNTPDDIWKLAAECLGTGIGLPAIYNDEVMCPALEKCGILPEDAHDYCLNGCNQVDIFGKSKMGLEDGEVNFAKVLEFTLHNGYDMNCEPPELISFPFGPANACTTFEEFYALFKENVEYITDRATEASNTCQRINANITPNPLRSCFIEGCFEKGRDYMKGGPTYNDGQVLSEGLVDAADSLFAIKKLIFDEKRYTMSELIAALECNFEGCGQLYRDFAGCEKFGNDIPEVDIIATTLMNEWSAYLKTKKTYRGGIYTSGCSPFSRAADNGMAVAALPNGKKKGQSTLADSIAATPGNDVNGPTASVKSMLGYDQTECCSGFVSQFKFDSNSFNTEKGTEAFISLAKTYFENGGQQISVNVLDRDTLLKAQKNPEEYRGLIVRVGGYSDYFVNLSPGLQQNVIDRTLFTI